MNLYLKSRTLNAVSIGVSWSCRPPFLTNAIVHAKVSAIPEKAVNGRFYCNTESDDDGFWSIQWSIQRQKFSQKCPCASACRTTSRNGFATASAEEPPPSVTRQVAQGTVVRDVAQALYPLAPCVCGVVVVGLRHS